MLAHLSSSSQAALAIPGADDFVAKNTLPLRSKIWGFSLDHPLFTITSTVHPLFLFEPECPLVPTLLPNIAMMLTWLTAYDAHMGPFLLRNNVKQPVGMPEVLYQVAPGLPLRCRLLLPTLNIALCIFRTHIAPQAGALLPPVFHCRYRPRGDSLSIGCNCGCLANPFVLLHACKRISVKLGNCSKPAMAVFS